MSGLNPELLEILVCPDTRRSLKLADASLVERVNQFIRSGKVTNRGGQKVTEPVDGGLTPEGSGPQLFYPIREEIPVLLVEEGISLESLKD
ncbi:MAG: hypothetical protein COV76_00300 [Candidatus Omnitrophica bacterium CG11_big_fil_rev_8_21_14_0_20_64_10]|nr:MAG: hypothetical protein COV76_00300 [Candidatus Omnitrophica bacterium CG11_big_fil_rev_8_21_14_0_20_64_10]